MVKLQVLGNNSKTVNNIKNLTLHKNDEHIKIYLPCKFEVNLIAHLGVKKFTTYDGRRTTDDGRRMDDGRRRRTPSDGNSSHGPLGQVN
jgi:hypothetical protein